jgi:rhamnose utilization protein RhaD (predicted bifunctional aldolase and dehydrogenase)
MLHALMPQAIIVHLHAVDILAFLVRKNASENIKQLIGDSIEWIFVDYFKPGADLAKAISEKLILSPKANVVFLKNHGLIIGGEDLKSIQFALDVIFTQLKINPNSDTFKSSPPELKTSPIICDYILSPDIEISRLATDPTLTKRLEAEWSLYPDHVVFLGSEACIVENADQFNLIEKSAIKPIFIFFIGHGVFESPNITSAQRAQLRCYFDVIVRQPINESLNPLSKAQIAELLDWDAEQYRQIISLKS